MSRRDQAALEAHEVTAVHGAVQRYEHDEGRIRELVLSGGGEPLAVDMVFVSSPRAPRTRLAGRLGARRDPRGYLVVDAGMRTTVPGLYAAGDILAGHPHQVGESAATGAVAATAVSYDLMDPAAR